MSSTPGGTSVPDRAVGRARTRSWCVSALRADRWFTGATPRDRGRLRAAPSASVSSRVRRPSRQLASASRATPWPHTERQEQSRVADRCEPRARARRAPDVPMPRGWSRSMSRPPGLPPAPDVPAPVPSFSPRGGFPCSRQLSSFWPVVRRKCAQASVAPLRWPWHMRAGCSAAQLLGREEIHHGPGSSPGIGGQACLKTGALEEGEAVPSLLHCHPR